MRFIRTPLLLVCWASAAYADLPWREERVERREAATEAYPELSGDIQNPLARILLLPNTFEYEEGGGSEGTGEVFRVRFGPRIPIELSADWHLISKS